MSEVDWLDQDAYPVDPHFIDVEGGRMHYVDEGEGDPLLMVHGNPTWSFLYRHLIRRFSPDFRCVAPDHIGFGLSEKPTGRALRPREHAQNLRMLVESLGLEGVTLVVQDWGGPIGLSYGIEVPDNVARLVILNTWMWPVAEEPHFVMFSRLVGGSLGRFLIRRFNFFVRVIMRQAYGERRRLTRDIHAHYLRALASPEERRSCAALPGEILGSGDWLAELWERRGALENKPALIVWGLRDIAFREKELDVWSGLFPAADVVRLPDVGHFVQEEAPDELASSMETLFLGVGNRVTD